MMRRRSANSSGNVRSAAILAALILATASPAGAVQTVVAPAAPKAATPACANATVALVNTGFEQPSGIRGYRIFNESLLPGWSTTATDRAVELWASGFLGVPSYAGSQFAELNANQAAALYQDVDTIPGTTVNWSLAHRGRDGVDVMRVLIGPAGATLEEVAQLADGSRAWGRHSGTYTIPEGQTRTRFQFEAVSAAGGPSVGNFLDDITFGVDACVRITKTGELLGKGVPGDRIRWTVTATNNGGSPASDLVIVDPIPENTSYAARSMVMNSGPKAGAMTDAADSDPGTFDGAQVRLEPVGDTKVPGRLNPGETARFSFETVLTADSAVTLTNQATGSYSVGGGDEKSASSNIAKVAMPGTTDVSITKTFDKSAVTGVAGVGPAGFVLEVANNGPLPVKTATITDPLPAGMVVDLANITFDGDITSGSCTVGSSSPAVLTCELGAMAANEVSIITVPATLTKTVQGSEFVSNEASVATTGAPDNDLTNNVSSDVMSFDPGLKSDVAVRVTALDGVMQPGDSVAWQVDVQNATSGVFNANDVAVAITLPNKVTLTSTPAGCTLADRVLTCALGSLAPHAVATVIVNADIDADTPGGASLELSAIVSADALSNEIDTNDVSSDTIKVVRPAELSITKRALGPVAPTVGTTFEIVVTSTGAFEADNVMVHDFFSNATVMDVPDGCTEVGDSIVCEVGDIPAGQSRTLMITLLPTDATQPIRNRAEGAASNWSKIVQASAAARPIVIDPGEQAIPTIYFDWEKGQVLPEVANPNLALPKTGTPPWLPLAAGFALVIAGVMLRRRVHQR